MASRNDPFQETRIGRQVLTKLSDVLTIVPTFLRDALQEMRLMREALETIVMLEKTYLLKRKLENLNEIDADDHD